MTAPVKYESQIKKGDTPMKTVLFVVFATIAIAIAIAALMKVKSAERGTKGNFVKRPVATANEQGMFWRLVECFPMPEHIVLTQVSFGALLNAKDGASRYSFSQKRADFVLLDKSFKVIAVIELDDSSHKGREKEDGKRDAMLMQARYNVLRYSKTPDKTKLMTDIKPLIS
jgi:hypothetical protein